MSGTRRVLAAASLRALYLSSSDQLVPRQVDSVILGLDPLYFWLTVAVAIVAGFVKGAVGFAMPTIMISVTASYLSAELALATLLVPTVLTNLWQALRGGCAEAWGGLVKYRVFLAIMLVSIALSAQLVTSLPQATLFLTLGIVISLLAAIQLFGWMPAIRPRHRQRAEAAIAAFAGFVGGLSGSWGPPTVIYLTAMDTPKSEQLRIQGVIFGIGGVVLLLAHIRSGVLTMQTLPLSVTMVLPALLGLMVGFAAHDRMDQSRFRRFTLVVLVLAGANLIRRGLFG